MATETVKHCRLCGSAVPEQEAPVTPGYRRVTYRVIVRIFVWGLKELSARRLDKETEKKVVPLMRRFGPYHEDFQTILNRRLREIPLPDGEDEENLSAATKERRAIAQEDLLNETVVIKDVPEFLLLDEDDMPVSPTSGKKKDEVDTAMQTGVASIKYNLDFLYIGDRESDAAPEE